MVNKREERDALEEIHESIKALGEDSRIGAALKRWLASAEKTLKSDETLRLEAMLEFAKMGLSIAVEELCAAMQDYNTEIAAHRETERRLVGAEARERALSVKLSIAQNQSSETLQTLSRAMTVIGAQELEIASLKATGYDAMTAGREEKRKAPAAGGKHSEDCRASHPECLCNSCAKDSPACCAAHERNSCPGSEPCPDYEPEIKPA